MVPIFINDPKSLPRNPPDWMVLQICTFGSFKLVDELLLRVL